MPFQIVRNDITHMSVDAIVNAANPSLLGGGGVDGAIHRAAGPELLNECKTLGGCLVGQAKLTNAYHLPCKYVIHTVGPKWRGGLFNERQNLASCYRSALNLAKEHSCETIAFPLISTGTYGYPKDKAIQIAVDEISKFLVENEMMVYLVIYGKESLVIGHKLFADIQEYIDDHYVSEHLYGNAKRREWTAPEESISALEGVFDADNEEEEQAAQFEAQSPRESALPDHFANPLPQAKRPSDATQAPEPVSASYGIENTADLSHLFDDLDESFQQMLLRKIDESGMTDADCYRKANVDRKLFSKIRKDTLYKPSKPTAIAFAIALELDLQETESLLKKAGFALSRSSKFDVIIQYFIEKRIYDIYIINEILFYFDQSLLGT